VTGTGPRRDRPSAERPDDAMQQKDAEPGQYLGSRRPPEYVIVVAASPWVKERFPSARANLWDALQAGKDVNRDPEPDLVLDGARDPDGGEFQRRWGCR
jgi:hypothetical protein